MASAYKTEKGEPRASPVHLPDNIAPKNGQQKTEGKKNEIKPGERRKNKRGPSLKKNKKTKKKKKKRRLKEHRKKKKDRQRNRTVETRGINKGPYLFLGSLSSS